MKLRTIGQKLTPSKRVRVRVPDKRVDNFYASRPWRELVDALIKQRGRRCEDPMHDASQPRSGRRIYGDHIVELRDGGTELDPQNIMLRCGSCHTRKTAAVRADRLHGGVLKIQTGPGQNIRTLPHGGEFLLGGKV